MILQILNKTYLYNYRKLEASWSKTCKIVLQQLCLPKICRVHHSVLFFGSFGLVLLFLNGLAPPMTHACHNWFFFPLWPKIFWDNLSVDACIFQNKWCHKNRSPKEPVIAHLIFSCQDKVDIKTYWFNIGSNRASRFRQQEFFNENSIKGVIVWNHMLTSPTIIKPTSLFICLIAD